jgi:hypothetical protein
MSIYYTQDIKLEIKLKLSCLELGEKGGWLMTVRYLLLLTTNRTNRF